MNEAEVSFLRVHVSDRARAGDFRTGSSFGHDACGLLLLCVPVGTPAVFQISAAASKGKRGSAGRGVDTIRRILIPAERLGLKKCTGTPGKAFHSVWLVCAIGRHPFAEHPQEHAIPDRWDFRELRYHRSPSMGLSRDCGCALDQSRDARSK